MFKAMFHSRSQYSPLADEHERDHKDPAHSVHSHPYLWKLIATLEFVLIVIAAALYLKQGLCTGYVHSLVPRPVIEYETRVFTRSIPGDTSIYQGEPSLEVDALWESIYAGGIVRISEKEQRLLPNKTARLPDDPDSFISEFTVFHNLHCLNFIRKTLYPKYYLEFDLANDVDNTLRDHVSHCIDVVRQVSMCTPDTTPLVWQWSRGSNKYVPSGDVTHQCVNFDKFHGWVKTRALQERQYNPTIWVEGNPVWGETQV